MKQLSIRLNDQQYSKIKEAALNAGQSITDFVTHIILEQTHQPIAKELSLTIHDVDNAADKQLNVGDTFVIRDLFKMNDWTSYSKGSRLSVGRAFNKAVLDPNHPFSKKYHFERKGGDHAAIYKKMQ